MTTTLTANTTAAQLLAADNLSYRKRETERITRKFLRVCAGSEDGSVPIAGLPGGTLTYDNLANLSKSAYMHGQFPHHKATKKNRGLIHDFKEWRLARKTNHKYTNLRPAVLRMTTSESDESLDCIMERLGTLSEAHAAELIQEIVKFVEFSETAGYSETPETLAPTTIHHEITTW